MTQRDEPTSGLAAGGSTGSAEGRTAAHGAPMVHVTSARAAGDEPDAVDAPFALQRVTVLVHELGNLLDGSMRCLGIAKRALGRDGSKAEHDAVTAAVRHLDTVGASLERMADLLHAAMSGAASAIGSTQINRGAAVTLSEAMAHAVEVMTPAAAEQNTTLRVALDPATAGLPSGPVYPVILNGLKNALESTGSVGGRGTIEVRSRIDTGGEGKRRRSDRRVIIEISDDGQGLPANVPPASLFDYRVTTKSAGTGIGLAIAREIAREMHGTIEIVARADGNRAARPGAVLRLTYPAPEEDDVSPGHPDVG